MHITSSAVCVETSRLGIFYLEKKKEKQVVVDGGGGGGGYGVFLETFLSEQPFPNG